MSKSVVLGASPPRLVGRILRPSHGQLLANELIRVRPDAIGEQDAVIEHVSQLAAHSIGVGICAPLEALEQLASFDRDALREVLWSMELGPVSVR